MKTLTWENAPNMLTVSQAATLVNVHVNSIRAWIYTGKLKATRTPGGHYRIAKTDLIALLDS